MKIPYKELFAPCTLSFWFVIFAMLVSVNNINAEEKNSKTETGQKSESKFNSDVKEASKPDDIWWSKWDVAVKDPNDPNEILEAKWKAIINVLQSKDQDMEQKKKIIDKITSPIFDVDLMAKLSLGKTNWPKLTAQQQKDFTKLFAERIKSFYLEKTTLYNDQKVTFLPAIKNRNNIYIPMKLISSEKEISILYKFHKINETEKSKMKIYWKIYDVEIEGVSVLLTYQSQFDDILRKGSVNDLFEQLEKPSTE